MHWLLGRRSFVSVTCCKSQAHLPRSSGKGEGQRQEALSSAGPKEGKKAESKKVVLSEASRSRYFLPIYSLDAKYENMDAINDTGGFFCFSVARARCTGTEYPEFKTGWNVVLFVCPPQTPPGQRDEKGPFTRERRLSPHSCIGGAKLSAASARKMLPRGRVTGDWVQAGAGVITQLA